MQSIQLYAYDQSGVRWELDLYEEDPIKITISAEDIIDIPRIDASFSRQFRIPATGNNSKFFKFWFVSGIIDFDVTKKVKSEIHVDGVFYRSGQLRLEAAYVNGDTSNIDFEVIFLGETKDFATQIGDAFLRELPFEEGNHYLSRDYISTTWDSNLWPWGSGVEYTTFGTVVWYQGNTYQKLTATSSIGETPTDYPLVWQNTGPEDIPVGAIRYILAQRGYEYTPTTQYPPHEISTDSGSYSFTSQSQAMWTTQFTPIIQIKYILDKIFDRTTYTYSIDSVFNEDWFKYLYTDGLPEAEPVINTVSGDVEVSVTEPYELGTSLAERVQFDTVILDDAGIWNRSKNQYVSVNNTDNIDFTFSAQVVDRYIDSFGCVQARLWKQEVGSAPVNVHSSAVVCGSGSPGSQYTMNVSFSYLAGSTLPNTTFWVTLETSGASEYPFLESASLDIDSTASEFVSMNSLLKADVKQIDFLRSILTKFRLVMVPCKIVKNQFIIKPWKDYVGTGDVFDWTNKLDYTRDAVIKPVFFSQSATIEFTDLYDNDYLNEYFTEQNNYVYGRYLFNSENELINEVREVTTVFAPTPIDVIEGEGPGSSFIIPKFVAKGGVIEYSQHDHLEFRPMRVKPRLLFWNGLKSTGGVTWYYNDEGAPNNEAVAMTTYPCATQYSDFLTTPTTLHLNWNIESDYVGEILGESVYTRYWETYINNLYSPEARIMTAYFKINASDLRDLTFDDVIFIKDAYWRVQKIYDAPLTDIDIVKVDLIRLIDYVA